MTPTSLAAAGANGRARDGGSAGRMNNAPVETGAESSCIPSSVRGDACCGCTTDAGSVTGPAELSFGGLTTIPPAAGALGTGALKLAGASGVRFFAIAGQPPLVTTMVVAPLPCVLTISNRTAASFGCNRTQPCDARWPSRDR